jgi:hypothetical protein
MALARFLILYFKDAALRESEDVEDFVEGGGEDKGVEFADED